MKNYLKNYFSCHGFCLHVLLLILVFLFTYPSEIKAESLSQITQKEIDSHLEDLSNIPEIPAKIDFIQKYYNKNKKLEGAPIFLKLIRQLIEVSKSVVDIDKSRNAINDFIEEIDPDLYTEQYRVDVLLLKGRYYIYNGKVRKANYIVDQLLSLVPNLSDLAKQGHIYYLGTYCAFMFEDFEMGKEYSLKAASKFEKVNDAKNALKSYDSAIACYIRLEEFEQAKSLIKHIISSADTLEQINFYNIYLNYSGILLAENQKDSSFYYLKKAYDVVYNNPESNAARLARVNQTMGDFYISNQDYKGAVPYYKDAYQGFKSYGEIVFSIVCLDSLNSAYEKLEDYQSLLFVSKERIHLKDSLRESSFLENSEIQAAKKRREELLLEFKNIEKNKKLARVLISKRNTKMFAYISGISALLLSMFYVWYRFNLKSKSLTSLNKIVNKRIAKFKEQEELLKISTLQLEKSNQELENFAKSVSNDLKTPLIRTRNFLDDAPSMVDEEQWQEIQEYFQIAKSNTSQMKNLVSQVLDYSSIGVLLQSKIVNVSLDSIIEQIVEELKSEFPNAHQSIKYFGNVNIILPKGVLETILKRILHNALHYNESENPAVKIVINSQNEKVRIVISDNGIGIPKEYHKRIFEIFRRLHTSSEYEGAGVGLALCKKLLKAVNGSIFVDSEIGAGTTFILELPTDYQAVSRFQDNKSEVFTSSF